MKKDYYQILGVLPDAEDIVIRAAYKALAQKYHPDRSDENIETARRMAEINQAYEVLGNSERRRQYDESRASTDGTSYSDVSDDDESEDVVYNQLQKDWALACDFYPDLVKLFQSLNLTSKRLALTYMLYLLETKRFEDRSKIASDMEKDFLQKYFGSNQEIIEFARTLIRKRNKQALAFLNNAVRVLGAGIDPKQVILKVISDFPSGKGVKKFTDEEMHQAVPHWSAFRWAVVKGDAETLQMLLYKAPALVAGQDTEGNTCLHFAVQEQQLIAIALLLENGANPELPNNYKTTALDLARKGSLEKIKAAFRLAGYQV